MDLTQSESSWRSLHSVEDERFENARLQLHHAAQIPASFAKTVFPQAPDYSHTALVWDEANQALIVNPRFEARVRPGLRVQDLSLIVTSEGGDIFDSFDLKGETLDDGIRWLHIAISRYNYDLDELHPLEHEMPDHGIGDGQAIDVDDDDLDLLARWYSNANTILQEVHRSLDDSQPVYCWPHHFDIATLVKIDDNADHNARSVGFGLTPGDDFAVQPYWYVLPWPAPDKDELPDFESPGEWHTEGWTGALLKSDFIVSRERSEQHKAVAAFLAHGWEASVKLLTR